MQFFKRLRIKVLCCCIKLQVIFLQFGIKPLKEQIFRDKPLSNLGISFSLFVTLGDVLVSYTIEITSERGTDSRRQCSQFCYFFLQVVPCGYMVNVFYLNQFNKFWAINVLENLSSNLEIDYADPFKHLFPLKLCHNFAHSLSSSSLTDLDFQTFQDICINY